MVRFSSIILVYFICAAVMFGAGAIDFDETGMVGEIVEQSGADGGIVNNDIVDRLNSMGGPIGNIIGTVGGGLLAAWNVMTTLIDFTMWPITVLVQADAPFRVVVLGGGTLVMAFIGGVLRTVRGSA